MVWPNLRLNPGLPDHYPHFTHWDNEPVINIYIYMDVWVWVSVCVCGWVAKEGILSLIGVRVSRGTLLSTLVRRPHKELCSLKPTRDQKRRVKSVSQLGVRLWSGQSGAEKQSVRSRGSVRWVCHSRVWSQDRVVKMSQHFW